MHLLGFAIVPEATKEAVHSAMAPFEENQEEGWDWYCIGGRYDGYLISDPETRGQQTHNICSCDSRQWTNQEK